MAWHDIRVSCTALGPSGRHCSPAQALTPLLPSVTVGETIKHQQQTDCCDSELAEFTLKHQSWQTWCPKVSEVALRLSRRQLASAASTKSSSNLGSNPVPAVPSHGILQTPKYELGPVQVAPGLIIDERLFIEELVIPDSTVATTEWRLDFLESLTFCLALNFGALFVIQLLYRYPVSHGLEVWLALLCVAVRLTGTLRIQFPDWRCQFDA